MGKGGKKGGRAGRWKRGQEGGRECTCIMEMWRQREPGGKENGKNNSFLHSFTMQVLGKDFTYNL